MHRSTPLEPLSRYALRLAAAALLLGCLSVIAAPQTAIFNIPSTDTQDAKKLYLEGDFYTHIAPYADDGFHSYSPVVIYGLSRQVEVGANLVYERGLGDATLELQPNSKWKFFEREEAGVAASVGGSSPHWLRRGKGRLRPRGGSFCKIFRASGPYSPALTPDPRPPAASASHALRQCEQDLQRGQ